MAAAWMARIILLGDVMLGRLVDQLQRVHVEDVEDGVHAARLKQRMPSLAAIDASHPWGSTLPYLLKSDLNVANLETSITTHPVKYPNKVFNFRMHPANVDILTAANINHVSLANNHVLDFGEQGMRDTMDALDKAHISFAGIGRSVEEARGYKLKTIRVKEDNLTVALFSASDHPEEWHTFSHFHFLDPTRLLHEQRDALAQSIAEAKTKSDIVIFSLHWGPNYMWQPIPPFQTFAHWLIDCGVDVIHGHSSHHVQGIEIYKSKPIMYGCGDFVDDYAVDDAYRNDLGFLYQIDLEVTHRSSTGRHQVVFRGIRLIPTKIKGMQVNDISTEQDDEEDREWLLRKMTQLCRNFRTNVMMEDSHLWIPIS